MAKNPNYPIVRATKSILREQFFDDANVEVNGGEIFGAPSISNGIATFDGVIDYLKYKPQGLYKIGGKTSKTFRAKIKFTGNGGAISAIKGSGTQSITILAADLGSDFVFTDGINAANNLTWPGGTFPNSGEEVHFVFVFEDTGSSTKYQIYTDGNLIKSGTFAIRINVLDPASITIGATQSGGPFRFLGEINKDLDWFEGAWTQQDVLDDIRFKAYTYFNDYSHYLPFANPNPLNDKSGKGNHAFSNSAVKLTHRNGYEFNISNMRAPNAGITGDAEFTIIQWLKPSATTAMSPICFGDSGVALAAAGLFTGVAGNGELSIEFAGGNSYKTATNQFTAGEAFCFAATKAFGAIDANTHLYKNGREIAAVAPSVATPNISDNDLYIGSFAGVNRFVGDIYATYIAKKALTPTQIRDISNRGSLYFGI